MLRIQRTRSFDNSGRWMIGRSRPSVRIHGGAIDFLKGSTEQSEKASGVDNDRPKKVISIRLKFYGRAFGRFCRDQNRNNRSVMTRLMKILQVESVIPHLINCRPIECLLTNFELNGEDNRPNHKNDIDAPSHSRNVEFEKN